MRDQETGRLLALQVLEEDREFKDLKLERTLLTYVSVTKESLVGAVNHRMPDFGKSHVPG